MPRWIRITLLIAVAVSALTACTVSFQGGLLGGLTSLLMGLLVMLGFSATQTGCIEDKEPDPDSEEASVGPCLSDGYIGPCLTVDASPPDRDAEIGPCLSQLEPDIGPCLQPPHEPDFGPCLSPQEPDVGPCLTDASPMDYDAEVEQDVRVGPCLEPPIERDFGPDLGPDAPIGPCLDVDDDASAQLLPQGHAEPGPALARNAVVQKVLAERGLPADVVERLKG